MVWFGLLLSLDLLGFAVALAMVAGWSVYDSFYWLPASLSYLGTATLVFHLLRSSATRMFSGPAPLRLGTRIERSLIRAAAWLALSTFLLLIGSDMHFGPSAVAVQRRKLDGLILVIVGAVAAFYSCRLLIGRYRRHIRWRSLCLRRESRTPL